MTHSYSAFRVRLGAVALAISGILFVLYPALRPFSDETSLEGADAFASTMWLTAHMLGMVAFTLLPVGLLGLHNLLHRSALERTAFLAVVLSVIGIGLALPFYGGEAFGLHAIGQEAVRQQDDGLLDMADVVRGGAGLVMFLVGLLLLAAAAIAAAVAIWRSGTLPRWGGILVAVGLVLYIPQFFFEQPVRVAHGLLLAAGLLWLAVGMWQRSREAAG